MNTLQIIPPKGYEIDTDNKDVSTITFRKIGKENPIVVDYLAHGFDRYNGDTVIRMGADPRTTDIARLDVSFRVTGPRGSLMSKPVLVKLEEVASKLQNHYNKMLKEEMKKS
jgi:hypothetical protein